MVQLVATLVGEIVLSCKEVNQKSRVAANEALVSIAHSMHNSNPPTLDPGIIAPSTAMVHDEPHLSLEVVGTTSNSLFPLWKHTLANCRAISQGWVLAKLS